MSRKYSFNERRDRGIDFLRYLDTEKFSVGGLPKSRLWELYNNQYAAHRQKIAPNDKLPHFMPVLQALLMAKIGYFINDKFYRSSVDRPPTERLYSARQNGSQMLKGILTNSADQGAWSTRGPHGFSNPKLASGSNQSQGSPKHKSIYLKTKIAVDQHITYNKMMQEITNQTDPSPPNQQLQYKLDQSAAYIKQDGHIFTCSVCQAKCTSKLEISRHLEGRRHRFSVIMAELRNKRADLIADKYDIVVTADCPGKDGTIYIDMEEKMAKVMTLMVENKSKDNLVELIHCEMLKRVRVFQMEDANKVTDSMGTAVLHPGGKYEIKITAEAKHVGNFHTPLALQFQPIDDAQHRPGFHIVRFLHAKCKNEVTEQLKPSKEYKHPPRVAHKCEAVEIVSGVKLPKSSQDILEKHRELDPFKVPDLVRKLINRGLKHAENLNQAEKVELAAMKYLLESELEVGIYQKRFQTLMYIEEIQMEVDIRKYDMKEVTMRESKDNKKLLLLKVPGLAENRPSVLKGDWLYVRICQPDGKLSSREYQGYVHELHQDEVALGFDSSLLNMFVNNMKFNVRFVFNRLPLRLQHRACQLAVEEGLQRLLFPERSMIDITKRPDTNIRLFNGYIEQNVEQKRAVQNIKAWTCRPAPYIVFGPPGTGKTVTIVEAMKQIHRDHSMSHILACTPSNSAADLIVERLLEHVPSKEILRLNAMSRSWHNVSSKVKDVSNYDKRTREYFFPSKTELCRYRIITCTLVTAGRLASANFPPGHFTHVFIDEAGHAVEPETLIAVAGILDPNISGDKAWGQLILAGDPKQLGPILRSPFAIKYGLDVSLLERYMNQEPYQLVEVEDHQHHYDERFITKLLRNYRSHPAILHLPNQLFYENELQACAEKIKREKLCNWEKLPQKGFPVVFHCVSGKDMREERSPSFFNPDEVAVVIHYVEELIKCKKGGMNIKESDIGIIAPYRKQVEKLRKILSQKNFKDIQVGSVEEFQGQEKTVILVSTVRSNPEYLLMDEKFKLGFLKNPKRFNVTITRAKALLVVVGNPDTLSQDPNWKKFIEYCHRNNSLIGEYREMEDEMAEIMERIVSLNLADNLFDLDFTKEENQMQPEVITQFNEQPWRGDV
ncbi:hypothetical protein ACJMK2_015607 [Sinanodonta woodiana]|uniref:RNA helicase n=1 Tax=Sinanodonta woodiana TaxID=1069815 RepID=A0ABD3UQY5_SINWO